MENKKNNHYRSSVESKAKRKLRMMKEGKKNSLFGFGLFGLVGWSVVVPTLVGLALGVWIDKTYPGKYSWTLMLLILGVCVGCLQAWYWIQKERKKMEKD